MKQILFIVLFIGTTMFAKAQTYTLSDLKQHVENINKLSPILTSQNDYVLNATLHGNYLYETALVTNKSNFLQLRNNPDVFKEALISAFSQETTGKMLSDTNTIFVEIWICKDATYPPFQIVIKPEEIKAKL